MITINSISMYVPEEQKNILVDKWWQDEQKKNSFSSWQNKCLNRTCNKKNQQIKQEQEKWMNRKNYIHSNESSWFKQIVSSLNLMVSREPKEILIMLFIRFVYLNCISTSQGAFCVPNDCQGSLTTQWLILFNIVKKLWGLFVF